MRPHRHLLVAVVLIGLGMVPQTGAAQGTGTSAARGFYLTTDPTRMTCLLPEESKTGEATGRCYVMECAAGGDRCTCPLKLPNGWKQPLSGEQCQQLGQLLPPLPPVEPAQAAGKEKPKAPGPATQVEKDKEEEDRNRDARNIGPPGRSFPEEPPAGKVRVDEEILRGINFHVDTHDKTAASAFS
jgi:hypothetical protein